MKKNVLCLGLLMTGVLACFQTEAQTITAPLGTPLTITNAVDVTGGGVNILTDTEFKIGSKKVISNKGTGNIFVGENSGNTGITGATNTFVGANSGQSNIAGTENVFIGGNAGASNTSGGFNLLLGSGAGYSNTSGGFNAFIGAYAGSSNTTGAGNVFIGSNAGRSNTTGASNFCLGSSAGYANTTGDFNSFLGTNAGSSNTSGTGNVFLGSNAGFTNSTGGQNIFIGAAAGYANSLGNGNIFLGNGAGNTNTTGTSNTYLGNAAAGSAALTNATAIGANASVTTSNTVVLGSGATVVIGASAASASPAKLEVTGSTPGKSGIKCATMATGALSGAGNNLRTGGFLTVNTDGEIVWAATGASRLGNPDGITSAEGTSTFSDNNWSLSNGYLKNTSKRGVVIGEGITSMPEGYSFYVADGILTEKVKVAIKGTDEWADYVFGKNYNRMSLTDVAKYIEKNNHLPNVPSAAEMVQNGNDLHKTDVKLLEKIEELTLYMIEMKKENEQLKKDVDSLKKRRK
jgi:trimeric autotransporter adhesin